MTNDASSYRRYQNGDNDAFALLVDEHYDALVLYLNTFVHSLQTAEELAEDTFVKIAVKKPNFKGKSSFRTWLFAIGSNTAKDYLRKTAKEKTVPLDEVSEFTPDDTEIETEYIKEERKTRLHRAMLKLKPEYRSVLWLVYFEDFSVDEAAISMKKTRNSTEHLLRRAKQALKTELEKEGFTDEEP